jgi:hypothetical protein
MKTNQRRRPVELAELPRADHEGTDRETKVGTHARRRGLPLDILGTSILVALVLVGGLIVTSAQGAGELGLGVALTLAALFLLAKEIRYAIQVSRSATQDGESDE